MPGLDSLHNRFAEDMVGGVAAIVLVDPPGAESTSPVSPAAANMAALARVATAFGVAVVAALATGDAGFREVAESRAPHRGQRRVLYIATGDRPHDLVALALAAREAGFDARVVVDACWIGDAADGGVAAARLVGAGVELTTWVAVIATLSQEYPPDRLPGHLRRVIEENLAQYAPALPAYWGGNAVRDLP